MARPVLIGMNNPISSDPEHALYPLPDGCTGNRLWKMLHEETGATPKQYLAAFERTNLVVGDWDLSKAKREVIIVRMLFAGRTVVLLGAGVREAFGHARVSDVTDPYAEPFDDERVTLFYQLPHPSGRNPWYNNADNRRQAMELLGSPYRRSQETPK